MTMDHARTCWAEGTGLDDDTVESLTEIAEEAGRRGLEVDLDPRDVWAWATALGDAGADDLADRVREIEADT